MQAKYFLGSLALVSAVALAAPSFAQQSEQQYGQPHRSMHRSVGDQRSYPNGAPAGSYGMDVAPGGGTYTRADVSAEPRDRMSHPIVGERRAPSNVAHGSLAQIDAAENAQTARLNEDQLNGQTAQLPSNQ